MHNKRSLLSALLISASIFSIVLVFSMFRHLKRMEADFNGQKAAFIKENLDLRDGLDVLQAEIAEKAEALVLLEEENEILKREYVEKFESLKKENIALAEKLEQLERKPLVQQIRDALYKEENENVKRFLEKVLYNIVLIKSGKSIELEPIVVAKKEEPDTKQLQDWKQEQRMPEQLLQPPLSMLTGKRGKVISVDKKYSLVVIDLGRRDELREGDRCVILKDEDEIATGQIINVRYKISAAFIDDIKYKYNIRSIQEGDGVLIVE